MNIVFQMFNGIVISDCVAFDICLTKDIYQKQQYCRFLEQSRLVQCGMLAAVHEIHDQTKGEPDCETHPSLPIQTANQNEAENDRADWREWHARSAEATVCVRLGLTHPQNARGHDDERRQRTDVHQFEQYVDVDETAGDGR